MKPGSFFLFAAVLFGTLASGAAHAARFGVVVGVGPGWGPYPYGYGYPYGYYVPPPPVIVAPPPAPAVYIDNGATAAAPVADANTWYYCRSPSGYYPYVKQCGAQWERVPAQPVPH